MKDVQLQALRRFASGLQVRQDIDETLKTLAYYTVQATRAEASVVSLIDSVHGIKNVGTYQVPLEFSEFARHIFNTVPNTPLHRGLRESRSFVVYVDELPAEFFQTPLPQYVKGRGWDKGVIAPLTRGDEPPIGLVHAFFPIDTHPDESEREFHETLASLALVAIENVLMLEQLEQKAVAEERVRLGRELHDSVSQTLFSIGLGAQAALEALDHSVEDSRESLQYISKLTRLALDEMRTLLYNLRPESFENETLSAALTRAVDTVRERYGLNIEIEPGSEPELTAAQKHALFRIATEGLHNAVKHSQASKVRLRVQQDELGFALSIEDDGVGFEPQQLAPGCFGLRTMEERARELKADWIFRSEPNRGTSIQVRMSPA